jgi:formate dehydrogenase major subunit
MDPRGRRSSDTLEDDAVQEWHRRGNAQRHAQCHIGEKLYDQQYVQTYVEGFDQIAENVKDSRRKRWSPSAAFPRYAARIRAWLRACRKRHHFLGHGRVTTLHGTDNARRLIGSRLSAARLPSRHLHPLRAEQRLGRLTPGYSDVLPTTSRWRIRKFAPNTKGWGQKLDPKRGKTVVEIMDAGCMPAESRGIHHGRKPAMSDPDLNHARGASRILNISWCRTSS